MGAIEASDDSLALLRLTRLRYLSASDKELTNNYAYSLMSVESESSAHMSPERNMCMSVHTCVSLGLSCGSRES